MRRRRTVDWGQSISFGVGCKEDAKVKIENNKLSGPFYELNDTHEKQ
jgi:hypothetical protein